MMGNRAFILLKVGQHWSESSKQAEIRLANLPKMLHIVPCWDEIPRHGGKGHAMVVFRDFRGIWLT